MMEQCGIAVVYRTLYEPPTVTNSWTLFIPGGNKYSWATSRGWTEGISSDKRLSLEGIVAVTFLHNELKREFDINGGAVTLYCLSKSLTHQLQSLRYKSVTNALLDNSDLLAELKFQLRRLTSTSSVQFKYLDFSNDKDTSQQYHKVSCLANVIADHQETLSLPLQPQPYISPPNSAVTLYHKGKPLVKHIATTLRNAMYSASLQHDM
jgi:hypothetical protein